MTGNDRLSLIYSPEYTNYTNSSGVERSTTVKYSVDIVFVHGLGGHPINTWTDEDSSVFWPKDLLPTAFPRARILSFGWQSTAKDFSTTTATSDAEYLIKQLYELRKQKPKDSDRSGIIFVAHSLGGAVVKQTLCNLSDSGSTEYRETLDSVLGVVFLGTTHSTNVKDLERALQFTLWTNSVYSAAVGNTRCQSMTETPSIISEQLNRAALSLRTIQEAFKTKCNQKLINISIKSFREELPLSDFGLVVNESATTPFLQIPLHADHQTICQFTSFESPKYKRVITELRSIVLLQLRNTAVDCLEQDCLRGISVDNGSSIIKPASDRTCDWLLRNDSYNHWLNEHLHSILWIHGKPGSGKTVLTKFVTHELQHRNSFTASYFFHYSSDTTRSSKGLYRSLLFQLFSNIPNLMRDCFPLLKRKRALNVAARTPGVEEDHKLLKCFRDTYDLESILLELLVEILRSKEVFLFVDALDECQDSGPILALFSSILSMPTRNPLKVWLSGRRQLTLPHYHKACQRAVDIDRENLEGITNYVRLHIRLFRQPFYQSDDDIVYIELARMADGVFLWIKLVLDHILEDLAFSGLTEQIVNHLPKGLDEIYGYILGSLSPQQGDSSMEHLLLWIAFARRPLSVDELFHARMIEDNVSPVSNVVPEHYSLGLLVEVVENHVYLVHQSVKDFLMRNDLDGGTLTSRHHDLSVRANIHIAEICISYLSLCYSADAVWLQQDTHTPFLEYAATHWMEHVKLADDPGVSHLTLLQKTAWTSKELINRSAELYRKRSDILFFHGGWSLLHVFVAFDLRNLTTAMLEVADYPNEAFDTLDGNYRTPLSFAAENGSEMIVQSLLDLGANVNSADAHGCSPLLWASFRGHEAVCALLLDAGADLGGSSGTNALSLAAGRGHLTVIRLLLDSGANPNQRDNCSEKTALHRAAAFGDEATFSLLLRRGANPWLRDVSGSTALHFAVKWGHRNIITILLESRTRRPRLPFLPEESTSVSWVHRVTHSFLSMFTCQQQNQCPRGSSSQDSVFFGTPTQTSSTGKSASQNIGKRRDEGNDNQGEDSGNNPNKRPDMKPEPPSPGIDNQLRLACPFFKCDRMRYSADEHQRCHKYWQDVHRLKQHLYHNHFVKICPRCQHAFPVKKSQAEQDNQVYEAHISSAFGNNPTCLIKNGAERNFADGFDQFQQDQLKARTERKKYADERQYWRGVYLILFPGTEEANIPDPVWEDKVCKEVYDEHLANERRSDPHVREALLQIIGLGQESTVASIIDLFNTHQARTSMSSGQQLRPEALSSAVSPLISASTSNQIYGQQVQPPDGSSHSIQAPFDNHLECPEGTALSPMPTDTGGLETDSAFYSETVTMTEQRDNQDSSPEFPARTNSGGPGASPQKLFLDEGTSNNEDLEQFIKSVLQD